VGADSNAVECNAVESITDASVARDEYAKLHYLDVKITDNVRSNVKFCVVFKTQVQKLV